MAAVAMLTNYDGGGPPKMKWVKCPTLKISAAAALPDEVDPATEKLITATVMKYVNNRLGQVYGAVQDFDSKIGATMDEGKKLIKKTDAKSVARKKQLGKEMDAQTRAMKLLDRLFADIKKDIQGKVQDVVQAEFDKWAKDDKALRNHKIKVGLKITGVTALALTSGAVTITGAIIGVGGTAAGAAASMTGVGAAGGVPAILASISVGVSVIGAGATALGATGAAIVKIVKAIVAEMKGEKETRKNLVGALEALEYKIEKNRSEQERGEITRKSGKLAKLKSAAKKALKPKELAAQIVAAVKNEAKDVEKAQKAHYRSLTRMRQNAVKLGQSVNRAAEQVRDLTPKVDEMTKNLAAAQKAGESVDKTAVKSLDDLKRNLKHYETKHSAYMVDIDRMTNLVLTGQDIHQRCDAAVAAFKADQKFDLKLITKALETMEDNKVLIDGATALGKAGVAMTKASITTGKAIGKAVAGA